MISKEDVKKLTNLARLELQDEELDKMSKDLDSILEYVGQINGVLDENLNIEYRAKNISREDKVLHEPETFTEDLVKCAPQSEGTYIKVKKII